MPEKEEPFRTSLYLPSWLYDRIQEDWFEAKKTKKNSKMNDVIIGILEAWYAEEEGEE